jgi:hypothetical protein
VTAVNGAPALFRPVIHASPSLRFRKAREQQLLNVFARRLEAARVERGWNMKSSIGDHERPERVLRVVRNWGCKRCRVDSGVRI